ncbi:MAG: DUF4126 family protein [Acidobacteria bacterium]|nr:DUF4126 family protein [Acidobacteriota bacterium]
MAIVILCALVIGMVSGMRSLTAPAVVAVAARFGYLTLTGTILGWVASTWAIVLFVVLALGEMVADKLPQTPSRKKVLSFIFRIVSGIFCGACLGAATPYAIAGAVAGGLGAAAGTFGWHGLRARMAAAFGKDLPAALLEDALAIGFGVLAVAGLTL